MTNSSQVTLVYSAPNSLTAGAAYLRVFIFYKHINPLSPHDALKHHFTSLKTQLIFLQQRVLEQKFP